MPLDFNTGTWRTSWKITVGEKDVTESLRPWLCVLEVEDKDGTASDQVRMIFDDTKSQLILPRPGNVIRVDLMQVRVFEGVLDEIRSTGARGQGRLLTVTAKGFDTLKTAKQPLDFHMDNATLQEFLSKAAEKAKITMRVGKEFADIKREYWAADNESFVHLGERLANELGGTFKVRNDTAILVKRGESTTQSGSKLEAITVTYGVNLLRWEVSPFIGRPRHKKSRVTYYDRKPAKWKEKIVEIEDLYLDEDVTTVPAYSVQDEETASNKGKGKKATVEREKGIGTIVTLLNPKAQAEAPITLKGTRPGVDGTYQIASVRHVINRSAGSETQIEIKRPETKKDERKAGTGTSVTSNQRESMEMTVWKMKNDWNLNHPDDTVPLPPKPSR